MRRHFWRESMEQTFHEMEMSGLWSGYYNNQCFWAWKQTLHSFLTTSTKAGNCSISIYFCWHLHGLSLGTGDFQAHKRQWKGEGILRLRKLNCHAMTVLYFPTSRLCGLLVHSGTGISSIYGCPGYSVCWGGLAHGVDRHILINPGSCCFQPLFLLSYCPPHQAKNLSI